MLSFQSPMLTFPEESGFVIICLTLNSSFPILETTRINITGIDGTATSSSNETG